VVNQFKVELAGGRGHVIPDAVLLVNGIPLVVAEFKSPGIESALADAINQLLRYSNQRKELYPTQFTDDEGVERLFHWNQLLVASNFFEARAATIGAPPEAYLEWADTSPVPLSTVAEELGLIPRDLEAEAQAAEELRIIGSERGDRREFPGLDPRGQVPFVRLLLEELEKDRELTGDHRAGAIGAGLEMVERIRQEIRKVGFWRNPHAREVLTKALVRDLDDCGLCLPGKERDLAQRLVALAKENHENLTK
jgi:type I restriction enzyme R subunit